MKIIFLILLSLKLIYSGEERGHKSTFNIEIYKDKNIVKIHTFNSDGLDFIMEADSDYHLLYLLKKDRGKERLVVKWNGDGYVIRFLGITRKMRTAEPMVDRHILPYWLQDQIRSGKIPHKIELLVPELGPVPVVFEEEKGQDTLKITMIIDGIAGKIFRKKFFFYYNKEGLLVRYADSSGRSLVLQRIEN